MEIVYCGDGYQRFAEIAIDNGFRYGSCLPHRGLNYPIWFADQDWKKPEREAYILALKKVRPHLACVLDWESPTQLGEVLGWAEDAALYVDKVIVIPKTTGGISQLPPVVGGKPVLLGYSVPTKYGGTSVPVWEFYNWPNGVHLLGGSPQAQMNLFRYFPPGTVYSVDGNMAQSLANRNCQFWTSGNSRYARNRWWPTLKEADGRKWGDGSSSADGHYEAFRRSCINIMKAWREIECQS
jgi:hypothetical protein